MLRFAALLTNIYWSVMQSFMKRIRISGLVKFTNRVRHDFSRPISHQRLIQLQKDVNGCLESIAQILKETGLKLDSLPAPSRKAYQFLTNIDFDSISTEETALTNDLPPNSLSFPGLRSYFNHTLEQLAQIDGNLHIQDIYNSIRSSNENIEREIQTKKIRPEQLKSQSCTIRGWMAYFAQQENFDAYVAAIRQAKPIFSEVVNSTKKRSVPVQVHFLPMKGVYRTRSYQNLIMVKLPTPMICFDRKTLWLLAEWIFRKANNKQMVLDETLSEPYQEILSELDLLSGIVEHTAGMRRNLAESFERVNRSYFNDSMNRPRLAWSQTFTFRKFGHYDRTHDAVVVSMSLDRKDVPEYVIDFIVYHELLHKKLGSRWRNGRNFSHTSDFLRKEKQFRQYHESKAILNKLARPSG